MKYKLTDKKNENGLYQIESVCSFSDIKTGDRGGWVQSLNNLSQNGECWIYEHAQVGHNAIVSGNAKIYDRAVVFDSAQILGKAKVFGFSQVSGRSQIYGNSMIYDKAIITNDVTIKGDAIVCNNAWIGGSAHINSNAVIKSPNDFICVSNLTEEAITFTFTFSNSYVQTPQYSMPMDEFDIFVNNKYDDPSDLHLLIQYFKSMKNLRIRNL